MIHSSPLLNQLKFPHPVAVKIDFSSVIVWLVLLLSSPQTILSDQKHIHSTREHQSQQRDLMVE